jgi:IS1 family transposase
MARPKNTRETKHVQIDLGVRSYDRLTRLKDLTEAGSYSEVFSDALRLYEAVVNDMSQGNEILVREKDGTTVPYRLVVGP